MGERALPDDQRLVLLSAELIKETFLRQFAFHEVDAFCPMEKQVAMLQMLVDFYERSRTLIRNEVPVEKIKELPQIKSMERVKEDKSGIEAVAKLTAEVQDALMEIAQEYDLKI
jgi:V/A-type H+-transporting ATPase subunit A